MEVLAILVALYIIFHTHSSSSTIIYSDCQSAVNRLNKLMKSRSPLKASTRDSFLLSACLYYLTSLQLCLQWIPGHPERSVPDEALWSREMWGNHLADRAAAGSLASCSEYMYKNIYDNILFITPLPTVDAPSISPSLSPPSTWYFGNQDRQLTSLSLMDCIFQRRLDEYLRTRDADRDRRHLPPKWQSFNIPLAARMWESPLHPETLTLRNRLLWDKHWHPGNQAKSVTDPSVRDLISKCPLCSCADSVAHWNVFCQNPRATKLRRDSLSSMRKIIRDILNRHPHLRVRIESLEESYFSLLTGNSVPTDIWRGLWTSPQLDLFRISH